MNIPLPKLHKATQSSNNLILILSDEDKIYVSKLRECLSSAGNVKVIRDDTSPAMVANAAKQLGVAGVLVASDKFFQAVVQDSSAKRGNYEGSTLLRHDVEFVILPSLIQLQAGGYRKRFVTERYIQKLTKRESWLPVPEFSWTIVTDGNAQELYDDFATAQFMACDIETNKSLEITMLGMTGIWIDGNRVRQHTVVIPFYPHMMKLATFWADKFLQLPAEKVFQGGRYDNAYLARYGISTFNWMWDTMQLHHAYYAEQPKDLASLSAFYIRTSEYWKDLSKSGDMYTKLQYNALDCWRTANVFLAQLNQLPSWARVNYTKKFPLIFAAHMCEMRGIEVDIERFRAVRKEQEEEVAKVQAKLAASVGVPNFNANSPKQVMTLLRILGADPKSTDEKTLEALSYKNRFLGYFADMILDIRGRRKLIGTYMNEEKLFNARGRYFWLAAILPYGTETGRNASEESAFWCGANIQNIPRGDSIKQFMIAPAGFGLVECDSEQAESRDTAHIAGEESLIAAVSGSKDFHSLNCSAFFGVAYELIFSDEKKKTINKVLRDIAKRVNHGANYCMGAAVLVQTMGLKNIDNARRLLNLPKQWSYTEIAEFLLRQFHRTYPGIAGVYYRGALAKIKASRMLTGATGWTRYFFGDWDNKREFNSMMAHSPQSLNAMRLDEAFLDVFVRFALHPTHSKNFKLIAQIHDSIFFAVRKGHEYLIDEVRKCMEREIVITGYDGKTRSYIVPAAAKAGKDGTGADRWSETE